MSLSLIIGCFWVLAAAFVALLPMRPEYVPGVLLLAVAPGFLGWIAWEHGAWLFACGVFALLSMFRNPLIHFWRCIKGQKPEVPV